MTDWVSRGLILVNQVLAATVVLTSFSLFIYLLTYNLHSRVARAFCALLAFVLIVYTGDVILYEVVSRESAIRWLKFQWIGIAFVPAAYLHFSNAVLRTVDRGVRWRWAAVLLSYVGSTAFLGMVLYSDLLVHDGVYEPPASHLAAGPMFWAFALYFVVVLIWGSVNVRRARRRCMTRASRRRMTYLSLAFVAPALGVFPYLMLASTPALVVSWWLQFLLLLGNVAVVLMIVVMAYSVAYFGALTPDRVIKHRLFHYLLRGPLVGAILISVMLAVPRVQEILGLPRDTVMVFAVVGLVVLLQLFINRAKPYIDRVIYRQDRDEIAWIQTLDQRLLTTADLRTFLENVLAAVCDLLQVRTGFVAVQADDEHRLEAFFGDRGAIHKFLADRDLSLLAASIEGQDDPVAPDQDADEQEPGPGFVGEEGFWLAPLESLSGDFRLGILGVEARAPSPDLDPQEQELADLLIMRAREALEDRYLQQNVFGILARILPDIERLHRWQDAVRYGSASPMQIIEDSPIHSPEFQTWVKDALSHYWGGPKLTESPLLGLGVVGETARREGSNATQALHTVLSEAIERLRPAGERSLTTTEWILYNILELKFLRGLKVRDVARRLAMSESDLYRKQRVAIAEVARALAALEQGECGAGRNGGGGDGLLGGALGEPSAGKQGVPVDDLLDKGT
ncbi:MAG: histidine kinase N-terminal 7TM domain-containing protein [Anaerolineae bacterium]